jgi:hypothetical protein
MRVKEKADKDLKVIYGYLKQTAGKEFALREDSICFNLRDSYIFIIAFNLNIISI